MKGLVILWSFLCSVGIAAQENIFLSRDYWKANPTVDQIKKDISPKNDPTALNIYAFDATVYALLEKVNDASILYLLSLDGNPIEKRSHDSRTYIFWAAYTGNTEIMKYLLEDGAVIKNIKDSHGNTPVTFAAATGQKDPAVYDLFEAYGIVLNKEVNEAGVTALFLIAPYLETEDELNYLVNKGFNIKDLDPKGNTIFNYAARKGDIPFLKLLIAKGVSPTTTNNDGGNAMLYASMGVRGSQYSIETFQYLESLGVEPNVIGDRGRNPLHAIAYKSQDSELFNYFIKKGVDVNVQDDGGNTPFMNAVSSNTLPMVTLLSEHVENINLQDKNGRSALMMAIHRNSPDVGDFLIKKGADATMKDKEGNTLAYYLLNTFDANKPKDFEEKLSLLQAQGVTLTTPQHKGNTLVHIAAERTNLEALKRLKAFNIDMNATNNDGYTALHIAAMKSKSDAVLKYLLDQGADVSIKTSFEETVYELAGENEMLTKNNTPLNFLK